MNLADHSAMHRTSRGSSLIEVLLAMTVFGIAAALTASTIAQAYRHSLRSLQIQQALRLASDTIESLRATGSDALAQPSASLEARWSWQRSPESDQLFEATVEVDGDNWEGEPLQLRTTVWRRGAP